MMTPSLTAARFALFLSLFLVGCGGSSTPKTSLVPVTGTVLANGQPLANAAVTFFPVGDNSSSLAYGVTDASGQYQLTFSDGRTGCAVGSFRVVVSKFAQPDGSPFPADMAPEMQTATGVEHIPARYSNGEMTELKAEVPAEGGQFTFELKK